MKTVWLTGLLLAGWGRAACADEVYCQQLQAAGRRGPCSGPPVAQRATVRQSTGFTHPAVDR